MLNCRYFSSNNRDQTRGEVINSLLKIHHSTQDALRPSRPHSIAMPASPMIVVGNLVRPSFHRHANFADDRSREFSQAFMDDSHLLRLQYVLPVYGNASVLYSPVYTAVRSIGSAIGSANREAVPPTEASGNSAPTEKGECKQGGRRRHESYQPQLQESTVEPTVPPASASVLPPADPRGWYVSHAQ